MPEYASSEVTRASSIAPLISRWIPSLEKSLEYVLAARCPRNVRNPMARDPDSLSVSTSPMRTTVENSEPSRTTASAAVAPPFLARATTSAARSRRSAPVLLTGCVWVAIRDSCLKAGSSTCRAADRHAIKLQRGNADTDLHRLAVFAARAYAFVELEIIAHHRNFGEGVRAVADQRAVLERRGNMAVL